MCVCVYKGLLILKLLLVICHLAFYRLNTCTHDIYFHVIYINMCACVCIYIYIYIYI